LKTPVFVASIVLLTAVCIACSKNNGDQGPAQIFSWRIDNGAEQFSDSTSFLRLFGLHMIFGKKSVTNVSLSTNGSSPGLYSTFNANGGVGLTINGTQYGNLSGLVNISSSSNNLLSGTFNAVMIVANVDTINLTGYFNNIRYF
jgi:hypothetical protein